jgi:hypothetical protein
VADALLDERRKLDAANEGHIFQNLLSLAKDRNGRERREILAVEGHPNPLVAQQLSLNGSPAV